MATNIDILRDLVDSIPSGNLDEDRGEGIWTVREHVNHLALTQIMLYRRLDLFRTVEHPVIEPYIPSDDGEKKEITKSPEALVDVFTKWRQKQLVLLDEIDDAVWLRSADHPEYREYNFEILVRHIHLHDAFHMYRIEEIWLANPEYLTAL